MKYIKLYDNRHDFVFDEQRYFPNTALVDGEEEPTYFTDVEEVVFELTVTLPTEKVVTGQTYTIAVEYGGADVFSEATVTTTGDVTLNGTQFTTNTDGDFSVTATYGDKTVTLNGTSKLMTAAPTISKYGVSACGIHQIDIVGNGTKRINIDGVETTSAVSIYRKPLYEGDTAHDTVITATAQEEGKWESAVVTATFSIPAAQNFTASLSDTTLEDGQTTQLTVMYGSDDVSISSSVVTRASGDLSVNVVPSFIANYSTGSGSVEVWSTNPNLPHITINVTVTEASPKIVFADPDVKAIVANAYGSDGEISEAQAAAVTTWFSGTDNRINPFAYNSNINSFDEFGTYFTGVTEIGISAFYYCTNMKSVTIPANVTSIGNVAFSNCSSLESVTIPASVTRIGENAFRYCRGLTGIICKATTPPSLWKRAFDETNECPIYVPAESVDAYKSAFSNYADRIQAIGVTVSLSSENIATGETYTLSVKYNGIDVLSNATVTSTGDVTISGSSFTANSDGAFSITATYNGYTATLNGTASTPEPVSPKIVFADPDVKAIVANAYGTNGEITEAQAAAVTTWFEGGYNNTATNPFCKNESVDSFDEFGTYFTSVSEIGVDAFQACSNMRSITLPSSLTSIPDYTFSGCSSLGSVTIPAAVTSIGNRVFDGCTLLESINIPENVASIGSRVFERCPMLTYISVDASNSYFNDGNGSNAIIDNNGNLLYGGCACTVIPNTVNSIGENAFHSRYFEDTLTIPSSVTAIGNYAFGGRLDIHPDYYLIMESTTPPTLGTGNDFGTSGVIYVPTESVDAYKAAWSKHADRIRAYLTVSLSSENIVTGETYTLYVNYCGKDVFSNDTVTSTGDVTITRNGNFVDFTANSDGAFSITATYNGYTATLNGTASTPEPVSPKIVFADPDVKAIVANAYGTNGEITEEQAAAVTTWFSGTDSKTNRFYQNGSVNSFEEFSYFTGVTEIGNNAFRGCYNMESITIPENVTNIGSDTFFGCSNMTSITIPENVTSIGERAFNHCYLLGSITIPDSVTYIGRSAFSDCTGLSTLNLGSYVETIDHYAFNKCSSLTSVNIPDSVTTLGDQVFSSCTNLNTVTIGKSVSAIPSAAFPRTISYVSVSSQNNTYDSRDNCNGIIETATNKLILGCKNTVIPSTVTSICDSAFNGCTGLTSITIPSSVTSIGLYAFNGCTGLTSITIPSSVTSIGNNAFGGCTGLTSITIPSSVTSIGMYGFKNCSNLTEITCEATTPPTLGVGAFSYTNNCPILVPAQSVDAYKSASKWSSYASRIQAIVEPTPEPEYSTAVLDCSRLADADPLKDCFNGYYDEELEEDVVYQEPRIDCTFSGNVAVESGVITMSDDSMFDMFEIGDNVESIGYVKLTHPSADYKVDTDWISFSCGGSDTDAITVTFDSATLTTTISNFVTDPEFPFFGSDFSMDFNSNGQGNPIKITRIEVGYVPKS